jgi:hypothetical protein
VLFGAALFAEGHLAREGICQHSRFLAWANAGKNPPLHDKIHTRNMLAWRP